MRILGRSPTGNIIVELEKGESIAEPIREFQTKHQQLDWHFFDWLYDCLCLDEGHVDAVFHLVREITKARAQVAEFERAMASVVAKSGRGQR